MEGEAIRRGNDVLSFSAVSAPMLVESSPRAQVVPPERRWDAENSRVALALLRARLQHSVVDADVLAFRIELGESSVEIGAAVGRGDLFENRCCLGQVLAQGVGECVRAPDEHAAVPEVITSGQVLFSNLFLGLLDETTDGQTILPRGGSDLDVAVAGFGARGFDSHDHDVRASGSDLGGGSHVGAELCFAGDHVIGGEHSDDRVGGRALQNESRQSDGRCSVAANRLSEHLTGVQSWELLHDGFVQVAICDDPKPVAGG